MVEQQLAARGIRDKRVLAAMAKVPRERFVPLYLGHLAYEDGPLPIGEGQTISQPYIVAYMIEALLLKGGERVLEVGTGSGYSAAVLAEIAGEVHTIERLPALCEQAEKTLQRLGYDNVSVYCRDGTLGLAEKAPFDAIVVTAGGPDVPQPLIDQLSQGGRLVIPVGGGRTTQELIRLWRHKDGRLEREALGGVRFVPLIGEEGWEHAPASGRPMRKRGPHKRGMQKQGKKKEKKGSGKGRQRSAIAARLRALASGS